MPEPLERRAEKWLPAFRKNGVITRRSSVGPDSEIGSDALGRKQKNLIAQKSGFDRGKAEAPFLSEGLKTVDTAPDQLEAALRNHSPPGFIRGGHAAGDQDETW